MSEATISRFARHIGYGDFKELKNAVARQKNGRGAARKMAGTLMKGEGFDIESHKRLARLFDDLTSRGCYCMLTNHNTDLIHELYDGKGYRIDAVSVKRMINSDAANRVGEEVIICNF